MRNRFWFSYACFFAGQLLMPKIVYNGQKLTKLVRMKTAATTNATIPQVPVRMF